MSARRNFAALIAGLVFGLGLAISGMVNPAKIIGFLDVAGLWDPTLALVMIGAAGTYGIGYRLLDKQGRPWFAERFRIPTRRELDFSLIAGAAIFGVGWGLSGFCPGPALTAGVFGFAKVYVFIAGLVVGSLAYGLIKKGE